MNCKHFNRNKGNITLYNFIELKYFKMPHFRKKDSHSSFFKKKDDDDNYKDMAKKLLLNRKE